MAKESNKIKKEFKRLRKNLLDLSSRNQLLNFKPRSRTIEIENHSPSSIYQSLILQKKTLNFIANKKSRFNKNTNTSKYNNDINNREDNKNEEYDKSKSKDIWRIPKLDLKLFGDNNKTIKTNLTPTELQKRLFYINQQAKMMLQEQGYNILYIAIGFLEWKGGFKPNEIKKAPLILIPVTLERKKVGKSFSLYWREEEIQTNISLRAKLKDEGINLPEFEMAQYSESVNHYITKVRDLTSKIGWKVNNDIALGFFSFTKFIMYKDLNPDSWEKGVDLTQNEIISSIFNPKSINQSELFSEENIDELPYSDIYNVLDSDSSQTAVIENVKAEHNLVVEGPPGTGKSQTIVNLIAELIASGKTVLFVSEKMAALEVVKGRLESVGLGKFVLEIHSHKTRRKALLKDLERCLHHKKDKKLDLEEKFNRLGSLRNQLNQYGETLKEPYFTIGLSPYELYGMKEYSDEYFSKKNKLMALVKFTNPKSTTKADLDSIIIELESLAELYSTINITLPNKDNPWTNCNPGNLLPSDLREVNILINDTLRDLNELKREIQIVNERFGINTDFVGNLNGVKDSIEVMKLFEPNQINYISGDILKNIAGVINSNNIDYNNSTGNNNTNNSSFNKDNNNNNNFNDNDILTDLNMSFVIQKLEEYKATKKYYDKFSENINNYDINTLIGEYKNIINSTKFKLFSPKYKGIKNEVVNLYNSKYQNNLPSDNIILNDLMGVNEHINVKNDLISSEKTYKKVFGEVWDLDVDINDLNKVANWINQLNSFIKKGIFFQSDNNNYTNTITNTNTATNTSTSNVSEGFTNFLSNIMFNVFVDFNVENELNAYIHIYTEFESNLRKLKSKLNARSSLIFKKETGNVSFNDWENQLNSWKSQLSSLHLWSQYLEVKNKCENGLSRDFIDSIEKYNIKKEDVKYLVNGNFADALLNIIFYESPELSSFVGDLHENRIAEFKELDKDLIQLNRQRIYYGLNSKIPEVYGNSEDPESKVLVGEFVRKQGHLPVRTLLDKAGGLIKQIKPVFMLSPLSVAQYLDPTNPKLQFDVVIFDEASQVKPEDALGAFLRGRTGVVMGDTQQLPPTSFFDQMTNSEIGEEVATALDMESILHLCKLSFPVVMLKWHYRSRHESLIAVSNQEFYDNQLLIYPSPSSNTESLGLKFKYNPNNGYDRGKSSSNRGEARDVVAEIFKHFERYGDTKSLGVGTFSVAQMNAILEELELERKNHPELEHLFSDEKEDRFFVKNLETIQGDERDVILISIGYGFDLNGYFGLNFGPLNQEGGERRLNVLITRAKEKCVVFSNFKAYDMNLTLNTPFGVKALKRFLEYAENTSKGLISNEDNEKEPFVDAVSTFLESKGYNVNTHIGCAGFRVDLAIVDSDNFGRYVLGIECDGPSYSSSKVARDRDRLRDQVLNGLGWNIYHLWSTDWYRNRDLAKEKLISKIEEMKIKVVEEDERIAKEIEDLKKAREEELARIAMGEEERAAKAIEDKKRQVKEIETTKREDKDDEEELGNMENETKNIISQYDDYILDSSNEEDDNTNDNINVSSSIGRDNSIYSNDDDIFDDLEHPKIELDIKTIEELDNELSKELDDDFIIKNRDSANNITLNNSNNNSNNTDDNNADTVNDTNIINNDPNYLNRANNINTDDNNNYNSDSIDLNCIKTENNETNNISSISEDSIDKNVNDFKVTFKKKIDSLVSTIFENKDESVNDNNKDNIGDKQENITNNITNTNDAVDIAKTNADVDNDIVNDKNNAPTDNTNNTDNIDDTEVINHNNEIEEDDLEIEIKKYLEITENSLNPIANNNNHITHTNNNNNNNANDIIDTFNINDNNYDNNDSNNNYDNYIVENHTEISEDNDKYISGANINSSLRRNSAGKYRRPKKKSAKISDKIKSVPGEIKYIKNTLSEIENPSIPKEFFVIDRSNYNEDDNDSDDEVRVLNDNNNLNNSNNLNNTNDTNNIDTTNDTNNINTNIIAKSKDINEYNNKDGDLEEIIVNINYDNETTDPTINNGNNNNTNNTNIYNSYNNYDNINNNNYECIDDSNDSDNQITDYKIANNIHPKTNDIYKANSDEIASIINEIVLIEGPIHLTEVHKRIKEIYNVSRSSPKFKNTINEVIENNIINTNINANNNDNTSNSNTDNYINNTNITLKYDFLFSGDKNNLTVRKREKPNIDLISDLEIKKAAQIAIKSTNIDDFNNLSDNNVKKIVKEVAKYFGFKSTSAKTANRIKELINKKYK